MTSRSTVAFDHQIFSLIIAKLGNYLDDNIRFAKDLLCSKVEVGLNAVKLRKIALAKLIAAGLTPIFDHMRVL